MSNLLSSRKALPPLLRRVILILSLSMLMIGVMISCRQSETGGLNEFLRCIGIWLAMAALFALLTAVGYHLLNTAACKKSEQDLKQEFQSNGWSENLVQMSKNAFRIRTGHDKVRTMFVSVMAEHYDNAELEALDISESELSGRDLAAYRCCQLRRAVMTGKSQRAHSLFAAEAAMLDAEYQYQPDLMGEFTPYAEDALVYYELAAAICERERQQGRAEQYLMQAKLRIAQYPEAVQPFLERLIALSMQYARASDNEDAAAAKADETALRQQITEQSALGRGMQTNLLRMLAQCCIFGNWTQETLSASKFERKLPPPEPETPAGSNS